MSQPAIYNPAMQLTQSQRDAIAAQKSFRQKIAAGAKKFADVICLSASARSQAAPEPVKRVIPGPFDFPVGYFPPPWIPSTVSTEEHSKIDIRTIQVRVCNQYGVTRADLLSARRTADIVRPRQVAFYLAKKLTAKSLPQIGRAFGGRDHTTALHGIRKISELMTRDEVFAQLVADLEAELA